MSAPSGLLPIELEQLANEHRRTLKDEPETTVEVLGRNEHAVVRKVYRNRGTRWWQSFGRRSRAQREFVHLRAIAAAGVPCLEALWCSEQRRFGFVDESTLVTRMVPDCRTLKHVLRTGDRAADARARARLATAIGNLLAELHRHGFLWCTPQSRNWLVIGAPERAELIVSDTPSSIDIGRSLIGARLALVDLYLAAFSPSRRREWSAPERLRILRAYCGADRDRERTLWRRLQHRPNWWNTARRALAMFGYTYILRRARQPETTP